MLISFSHKFIFIHNPKVAGTSVKAYLGNYEPFIKNNIISRIILSTADVRRFLYKNSIHLLKNERFPLSIKPLLMGDHIKIEEAKEILPEDIFKNYFKFGFVRNPWDRLVSYYVFVKNNKRHFLYEKYNSFYSFDDFIMWIIENDMGFKQKEYFYDNDNNLMVDYVGKFENLNDDFNKIAKEINIKETELPVKKKSSNRSSYKDYYSEKSQKLVEDYYKEEIQLFGYSFD
jgi:hypothetical protein